jgi:hypothetical protein
MDAVTYPSPDVQAMLEEHFVPVRLERTEQAEQVHPFTLLWTPTFAVQDARGREFQREIGFLPPEDFLPALALAYAKGMFATGRAQEGLRTLERAIGRHDEGEFAPQLLYWRATLGYQIAHDRSELNTWWGRLQREYPRSTWSVRCSFFTPSSPESEGGKDPSQVSAQTRSSA